MRNIQGMMLFLLILTANTMTFSSSLLKVTPDNNLKCVEYYTYQGDLYCSTTPQKTSSTLTLSEIKELEKINISFDERPWQIAWGKKTPQITTIEYVPQGDDINQWNELITSQFIPASSQLMTPKQYANRVIQNLRSLGFKPMVQFFKESPQQVIFEFRILAPQNQQQDELQMVTQRANGLYILHYVIKKMDMGQANRHKWLNNLEKSRIKLEVN